MSDQPLFEPVDPDSEEAREISKANEVDEDTLAEIQSWKVAFEQEFTNAEANKASTPLTIRAQLKELVPEALLRMAKTIKYSRDEKLAFTASKWLLDAMLENKGSLSPDDPLVAFLEEMRDNRKTTAVS
jgi:hypothetical protein